MNFLRSSTNLAVAATLPLAFLALQPSALAAATSSYHLSTAVPASASPAGPGQLPTSLPSSPRALPTIQASLPPAATAAPTSGYDVDVSIVPLPILATLAAQVELRHTPGPVDQYAIGAVSWNWMGRDVYDPTTTTQTVQAVDPSLGTFTLPAPLASYTTPNGGLSPFFDARAGYGFNFWHDVRFSLIGHYMASNLVPSGDSWMAHSIVGPSGKLAYPNGLDNYYDPSALIDGPILTVGPHLDLLFADDVDFPTSGWMGRLAADFGPHRLWNKTKQGAPNDFAIYRAELSKFFPLGSDHDKTLLFNLLGGYQAGDVPMYFRFSSGGTIYQRGYLWDRFAGNEMAVGTVEYRDAAWPDLLPSMGVGLMYDVYADYGRVWQAGPVNCPACASSNPVPFGQDMRLGVGAGLGLMFGRSTIGRLDLMWGNEGVPYTTLFGQATTWEKIIPGVGLSCEETW